MVLYEFQRSKITKYLFSCTGSVKHKLHWLGRELYTIIWTLCHQVGVQKSTRLDQSNVSDMRDVSKNVWDRPSGSSMVGTEILPNNMMSPSPECYTTFWRMTIYSDTLHWWDITQIFDTYLIWTLLPNLTFYLIVWGFHRTFAMDAACQQRTLTPPETWSCPTLGLACVSMSRPISPVLGLFPDFWVSNIPRCFCFASG